MKTSKIFLFQLIILICVSNSKLISQAKYSKNQLSGKGGLEHMSDFSKLQPEVHSAFLRMKKEAQKEGITIGIVSGYRSYIKQKHIWNKKYNKFISNGLTPKEAINKIILYSTIPGTSRHHWGTEIDIIDISQKAPQDLLIEENYFGSGAYSKLKIWMDKNSEKYGFHLVYTDEKHRKGFKHEPWHYSYKPISRIMYSEFLQLDLKKIIKNSHIKGSSSFSNEFIETYIKDNIKDINKSLRE